MICLISPFFVVSVSAENIETTVDVRTWYVPKLNGNVVDSNLFNEYRLSIPRVNDHSYATTYSLHLSEDVHNSGIDSVLMNLTSYKVYSADGFFGDIGFYLSFYFVSDDVSGNSIWSYAEPSIPMSVRVTDSNGSLLKFSSDVSYFTPSVDSDSHSIGMTVSYIISVPEATPIISIDFGYDGWILPISCQTTYTGAYHLVVPSSALIADRTSEELKELQNLTNVIINQNNISNQCFGDVISKVDSLYTEVGNLADLQEQAIQQFDDWNTVSSVPGSVQNKVDKADQVIADINSLVKPDPEILVPSVDVNTDDISSIFAPFFENALILQLCTMVLGFAFVSYVLFGKKG